MTDNNFFSPLPEGETFLERTRINRLFETAIQSPIVTVTAGAGYGKSRAVFSFVRKYTTRSTWLQLSEFDNTGERFWEKFTGAISVINQKAAAKLAEFEFPVTERNFNRYLNIMNANEIPGEIYIFVLDDVHLIRDDSVLWFIERSVAAPHPNAVSILISRNELPFKFDKYKIPVARVTEENLRFSREETAEYFRLRGFYPSPKTISSIYTDTEGWAFAVNLAGLSLKKTRSGDVYTPQALKSNIFKLMESEIASSLPEELRRFLVKISLIDNLVPGLLREIADNGDHDYSLIDQMEQINTFIHYDPYLNIYLIHHLFLDFLRSKQGLLNEKEKHEVWINAARWCTQNDRWIDAITYYEKAGDYRVMLQAVDAFPTVFPRQIANILLRVMEKVPKEVFAQVPSASIIRTRALLVIEDFSSAEEELWASISKLEAQKKLTREDAIALMGCYSNLGFLMCVKCIYTHDYSYTKYFMRSHYYSLFSRYKPSPPVAVMYLSSYLCRACEAEEIENYVSAFIDMSNRLPMILNGCGYGGAELIMAELALYKSDISQAQDLCEKSIEKARQYDQYEVENRALFFLLRIAVYRGNYGVIPALLGQLEVQLNQERYVNRFFYHDIVTGWFYLHIGQPEKLAPWLKNDFEESDLNSLLLGLEILLKADFHFSEKRYPAALAVLNKQIDKKYSSAAFLLGRLDRKVLEAICRYRLDDKEGAFHDLEAAWEMARTNGLWLPFFELGKDMRTLAEAALKEPSIKIPIDDLEKIKRGATLYAKNIFAVSTQYQQNSSKEFEKKSNVILSSREHSVLINLSQGLTREEIARVSSISINTVKSVIRSIYSKTGALNRADAVRIAKERGIL